MPHGPGVSLFGLIFLAVGLGVLALGPFHTLYEHAVSADWRQVPATLESVNVRSNSGSGPTDPIFRRPGPNSLIIQSKPAFPLPSCYISVGIAQILTVAITPT
ncbi:uncharacterized protein DUF3592 [Marinobacter pelagius]|uniref:Uncharacterized protein DUF3592 n=1 Tax=Marinobacter pelagius TaxID=379482 RepID=A0A366GY91_9GAMM|nr:uncharacterized protein DUF3592 [Marinobacter pelagius]